MAARVMSEMRAGSLCRRSRRIGLASGSMIAIRHPAPMEPDAAQAMSTGAEPDPYNECRCSERKGKKPWPRRRCRPFLPGLFSGWQIRTRARHHRGRDDLLPNDLVEPAEEVAGQLLRGGIDQPSSELRDLAGNLGADVVV